MTVHVACKDLPHAIRRCLEALRYNRADISIAAKDSVCLASCGGDGYRAFAAVVNLETGTNTVTWGSWGGANMFQESKERPVDRDFSPQPTQPGFAYITGSQGEHVFASIYLHPDNVQKLLPAVAETSDEEKGYLTDLISIKPAYRRKIPSEMLRSLESRGLVKVNRAGSVTITTAGKNAVPSRY